LPQSKLCNYSSANLSGSLVGEAKGLALHLSDDTGLTELLRSKGLPRNDSCAVSSSIRVNSWLTNMLLPKNL